MEGVLALNDDDQIINAFVKSEDEISSVEGFHFVNERKRPNYLKHFQTLVIWVCKVF